MQYRSSKSRGRPRLAHLTLYGLIAGLIIGISSLAIVLLHDRLRNDDVESSHIDGIARDEYDGTITIDPPIAVPDLGLTNTDKELMRLSQLPGQFVLLTFGFTHCPDICPLTLNDFQRIRAQLGQLANEVQFVFVSVDGARDTPTALREYFSFRELDDIIALTGSEEEVRAFGAPLGLAFEVSGEVSTGGYLINHTAGSFLLDQEGRWIMRYQFGVPPETIVSQLRRLLRA